jgi:PAS domain S-box-containing protein
MLLALGGLSLFIAAGLALGIDYMIRTVVQQREKERIFLESIGDGIIAIDRSWRITLWNHAAEMMTGWTAAEAVGRSFRDTVKLVHELNGTENIGFIEETMLFGRANQMASDTLLIRRDGSKMPVADSAAPIYGGNGAVHGAIIVFRDVSADRDLARAREEMHALTSHQLQSPVTVIKYAASMLLDGTAGPISAQHRELIEQIARAAENMSHLTSMLLEASRAESGTIGVSSHPVSLEEVVGPILDDVAPDAAQRRITIERALSPSLPLVKADASIIEMGLRNLLANALKYTPPNGRVRVSTALEGKEFIIAVADTGIGVPEKERAELFKKFFRASNAREARADGTGLGLYVVKSLMEQAGGDVRYTPAEQGSVFSLVIPAAGMQPKQGIRLAI